MSESVQPDFARHTLIPAVTQDAATGEVLMHAWVDREAWDATLRTGYAHYHSRERDVLWKKGETSGNVQRIVEIRIDCDEDTILYRVEPAGPACHTGERTCFFRSVWPGDPEQR
jgi:phosphoribosyl-ATP pyrophosphohydrolase/phosphoribosyl-AMP cyclohydrolase